MSKPSKTILVLVFVLLIFWNWTQVSFAINLYEIPNPRDRKLWVSDLANLLDTNTENKLNQILDEFNYKYRSELIVVTVPETLPYQSTNQLTRYLFNIWHLNRPFFYNTALFVISKSDRCAEIIVNFNYNNDLTSNELKLLYKNVKNITEQEIFNYFQKDDYTKGILVGTKKLMLAIKQFLFKNSARAPKIDLTVLDRYKKI